MFKFLNKNKGFTLVEMLVSILIFSIIIGAATGVFVSAIKLQRYSLTHQQLLDQTSYAMEYMSRAIRMAQKDTVGGCTDGKNYKVIDENHLKFMSYNSVLYGCQEFFLEGNQLKTKNDNLSTLPLISPNFRVTSLKFSVSGDESGKQPRVTVFMEVQGEGSGSQPRLRIQTTISQRNLNI